MPWDPLFQRKVGSVSLGDILTRLGPQGRCVIERPGKQTGNTTMLTRRMDRVLVGIRCCAKHPHF